MDHLINLFDFERAAEERLDANALGYYAAGADDELTLADNHAAWARLRLLPRVLRDVAERDARTTVLGQELGWPLLVAPMAMQGMAHRDAELGTARAAGRTGAGMVLSTVSTTGVEDVVAAATGPLWFQLYVFRDREESRDLVLRARDAGVQALVLTVDAPVIGQREADVRNRFAIPDTLTLPHLADGGRAMATVPDRSASALAAHPVNQLNPSLTWKDVDWLASLTDLPVVVKGVLHPDDARLALEHGASAIIVSNHGGRQLDTSPATADVLPGIAEAVGDGAELLVDGGIRRGTDVLKALALGARAVLLGRPVLWGLAVGGEDGAHRVLELLREELDRAMALTGCRSVADITRGLLFQGGQR